MAESTCKTCGKVENSARAGSITSYFFQHNYCQCASAASVKRSKVAHAILGATPTCATCGKAKPPKEQAGSFTSFLFKELRCHCPDLATGHRRTNSAKRALQRKNTLYSPAIQQVAQGKQNLHIGPGTIIGGIYKIESLIGQGGMGSVYLVQHKTLPQKFALKILAPDLISEKYWQRFQAEARTLGSLNHPGLVKVYDLGIHENSVFYYSMEYLPGQNLEEILATKGPFETAKAMDIFISVLDTLAYAHHNGIIHRDIKPANIFCLEKRTGDKVKILDFGIAKLIDANNSASQLTMAGEIFGSPFYMSPEQCAGKKVDARSDIYSVGCSLFETLTGMVPFDADLVEVALMHQEHTAPSMTEISGCKFSASLENVVAKCLAKSPEDRYQSAKELARDLQKIREGKEVFVDLKPSPAKATTEDNVSRVPWKWPALVTTLALLLAGGFLYFYNSHLSSEVEPKQVVVKSEEFKPDAEPVLQSLKKTEGAELLDSENPIIGKADRFLKTHRDSYQFSFRLPDGKKMFDFPEDFALGDITFLYGRNTLIEARGKKVFPHDAKLHFNTNTLVSRRPELLKYLQKDDFESIRFVNLEKDAEKPLRYLTKLSDLKWLELSAFDLGFKETKYVQKFKHLWKLNIDRSNIDPDALVQLIPQTHIRSLWLGGLTMPPKLLKELKDNNIDELSLTAVKMSAANYAELSKLTSLTRLLLIKMDTTDKDFQQLATLQNLSYLKLDRSDKLTVKCLNTLKQFKKLENLTLSDKLTTDDNVQILEEGLPRVKVEKLNE